MISLGRSSTSTHILDAKSKALCGFPNELLGALQLEDLTLFDKERDGRLCNRCEAAYLAKKNGGTGAAKAEARTGGPTPPTSTMHLKHKKSQLVELKDQLLTGEISYKAFQSKAYPLQKEIRAMEALPA